MSHAHLRRRESVGQALIVMALLAGCIAVWVAVFGVGAMLLRSGQG